MASKITNLEAERARMRHSADRILHQHQQHASLDTSTSSSIRSTGSLTAGLPLPHSTGTTGTGASYASSSHASLDRRTSNAAPQAGFAAAGPSGQYYGAGGAPLSSGASRSQAAGSGTASSVRHTQPAAPVFGQQQQ